MHYFSGKGCSEFLEIMHYCIGILMYEFASSHCTDFKDLRDDEDIVINREWILNKLTEEQN